MKWWYQTIYLLVLLLNLCQAEVEHGGFLTAPSSYISLTSENWRVNDDVKRIVTALRITPTSLSGQIMTLRAVSEDTQVKMEINVIADNGNLKVLVLGEHGQKIAETLNTLQLKEFEEQNLALTVDLETKTLQFRLHRNVEVETELLEDIFWADSTIHVILGGSNSSILGCVSLITVQIGDGDAYSHVTRLDSQGIDLCEGDQVCSKRNCGKGNCLQKEVAVCDCYGTGYSGPSCETEAPTIELNNSGEDAETYILYKPYTKIQTNRIALQFKFKGSNEGLLVYGWLSNEEDLRMYVVGNLGTVQISPNITLKFTLQPERIFHKVELLFKSDTLQLTVDDSVQETKLDYPLIFNNLTFGAGPSMNGVSDVGLTGCLKEVYVDHYDILRLTYDQDERIKTTKTPRECSLDSYNGDSLLIEGISLMTPEDVGVAKSLQYSEEDEDDEEEAETETTGKEVMILQCENIHKSLCQNKADCQVVDGNVTCLCQSGYTGSFCQFVLLPKSCAEAKHFFHLRDGPTKLDVDGSSKLRYSVAVCNNGITTIPNNMPTEALIRTTDREHLIFRISYLDFLDVSKLSALISNSKECLQTVNYTCNRAPLRFHDSTTFFRVATGNKTVSQIGRDNGTCQCHDFHNCIHDGYCHCDAGGNAQDSGVLRGSQAGITEIYSLYTSGSVAGRMSVGPLECSGFAGEYDSIQFSQKKEFRIDYENKINSFSIHFKTSVNQGVLLNLGDIVVELADAYSIRVTQKENEIVLGSQTKLNNSHWHLLRIEWNEGEFLFSVDSHNIVSKTILKSSSKEYLIINNIDRGFYGCIRSLTINNEVQAMREMARNQNLDFKTCSEHCSHISCQNDAECIEDYQSDEATCRCLHPDIQSGTTCEIDINHHSSVSLHGGFLTYENMSNPLIENTVFSFRTDQSNALLFYAHDHLRNFIQIHLREEVNLTLTLNRDRVIYSCTLSAPNGDEFSHMQWIQLAIKHVDKEYTQLRVNDEACIIRVPIQLSKVLITQYTNWNTNDGVELPIGLNPLLVADSTLKIFVGGVTNIESGDDVVHKLLPNYRSKLPNLQGCMRGLKIGNQVFDMRNTSIGIHPDDERLVRMGCDVGCDTLTCYNGGHCSIGWRNYDPSASKTRCDCTRTSYVGESCTDDNGLLLSNQYLDFNITSLLHRFVDPPLRGQSLKFAFSPTAMRTHSRQVIAVLQVEDSWFEVLLNRNSSLNVAIHSPDARVQVLTFNGNFSDGYRHFLVARFGPNTVTSVMVDSSRQTFSHIKNSFLDLRGSKRLVLGGKTNMVADYTANGLKKSYDGCISNVELNVGEGTKSLEFNLLDRIDDSDVTKTSPGEFIRGRCSAFRIPNQPPVLQNPLNLPMFHAIFSKEVMNGPDLPSLTEPENFGFVRKFLLIVAGIILFLIFITICVYCLRRSRRKPLYISRDEALPLHSTNVFIKTDHPAESRYHIPPPDLELDQTLLSSPEPKENATSSPRSQRSNTTSSRYYTANEEVSSDDEDKTIVADDDNYFHHKPERPSAFDRTAPQRLSSFRNDPTAPIGSPLRAIENPRKLIPVASPQIPKK